MVYVHYVGRELTETAPVEQLYPMAVGQVSVQPVSFPGESEDRDTIVPLRSLQADEGVAGLDAPGHDRYFMAPTAKRGCQLRRIALHSGQSFRRKAMGDKQDAHQNGSGCAHDSRPPVRNAPNLR